MKVLPGKYKFRKSEHATLKKLGRDDSYYKYIHKTFTLVVSNNEVKIKEALDKDDYSYYGLEKDLNKHFIRVKEKSKYKNFITKLRSIK